MCGSGTIRPLCCEDVTGGRLLHQPGANPGTYLAANPVFRWYYRANPLALHGYPC